MKCHSDVELSDVITNYFTVSRYIVPFFQETKTSIAITDTGIRFQLTHAKALHYLKFAFENFPVFPRIERNLVKKKKGKILSRWKSKKIVWIRKCLGVCQDNESEG